MGCRRACIAVLLLLLLQAWGAARARPSEGEEPPQLLDRQTIFNDCQDRPHTLPSPQALSGEWCEVQDPQTALPGPALACNRVVLSSAGEQLRVILYSLSNGRIDMTKNVTFSRIENQSWLSTIGERTTNLFIGLSEDERRLLMCGTTATGNRAPQRVSGMVFLRCLAPGESPAARRNVVNCELPPDTA